MDRPVPATGNNPGRAAIDRLPHDTRFLCFVERHQYTQVDALFADSLYGFLDVGLIGRLAMANQADLVSLSIYSWAMCMPTRRAIRIAR